MWSSNFAIYSRDIGYCLLESEVKKGFIGVLQPTKGL
jgi:hypothetical protein